MLTADALVIPPSARLSADAKVIRPSSQAIAYLSAVGGLRIGERMMRKASLRLAGLGGLKSSGPVPAVSGGPFTVQFPVGNDELVGHLTLTNSPTSLAIVAGDPNGYFAAYIATGNLRTADVPAPIPPSGTYNLTIAAGNANGIGTGVVQVLVPTVAVSALLMGSASIYALATGGSAGSIHGQMINANNTGRAGAAAASVANYSASLTTINGTQTYNTDQTIRNTTFTGQVFVTSGNVLFEFCRFTAQPPANAAALRQYNGGAASGTLTCNWCDFDTGLRGTSAGTSESAGFQAGERGGANPATVQAGSSFTLYRCSVQGFCNLVTLAKWQCAMSYFTECYFANATRDAAGQGHVDNFEIYSVTNLTVQRCRSMGIAGYDNESIGNITNDFGDTANDNPVIFLNNYTDCFANSPVLISYQGGTKKRNVQYVGNYFGDQMYNQASIGDLKGNAASFLNVTYDATWFAANQASNSPGVVLWLNNIWAPDGEGVTHAGHTPGAAITMLAFNNGAWGGQLLGSSNPYAAIDGSLAAAPGAPQYPNLLNSYVPSGVTPGRYKFNDANVLRNGRYQQPQWAVAGVDYAVGPRVALKPYSQMTQTDIGSNGSLGTQLWIRDNGTTLTGWDLTGHTLVIAANNVTVQDCLFAFNPGANNDSSIGSAGSATNITFQYCTFDGYNSSAAQFAAMPNAFAGTVIVEYCWFKYCCQTGDFNGRFPLSVTFKYNLLTDYGLAPNAAGGGHEHFLGWGLASTGGNASCDCSFNTSGYPSWAGTKRSGGEGYQGYGGNIGAPGAPAIASYNTEIATPQGDGNPHWSTNGTYPGTIYWHIFNCYHDYGGSPGVFYTDPNAYPAGGGSLGQNVYGGSSGVSGEGPNIVLNDNSVVTTTP